MTAKRDEARSQERFAFFMDILGHDILNNNQAVLSYLELMLEEAGNEKKVREYVQKAVPHIRTSTLLVENIRKAVQTAEGDHGTGEEVELSGHIGRIQSELERFFPDRRVRVDSEGPGEAWAVGGNVVQDLLFNAFVDMVKMDPGKDVTIRARLEECEYEKHPCWSLLIENDNAELPPILKSQDIETVYLQDSSTAVRMAGMMFAKIITSALGGDFSPRELRDTGEKRGASFTVILRKVGK